MPTIIVVLLATLLSACEDTTLPTPAPIATPVAKIALPPAPPAGPKGSIKGSVPYGGKIAPRPDVQHNFDPYCNRLKLKEEELVVNQNHTLKNVFVHVLGAPAAPPPQETATLLQSKCVYQPRVQGVVVGQTLSVRNFDEVMHNVHAFGDASSLFNRAQIPHAPSGNIDEKFGEPNKLVKFKCDIHPWMSAYAWVEPNALFAVSDASGNFEIKDVPEGKYQIEAWHETLGTKKQSVTVVPNKASEIKFDFTGHEGFGKM